MAFPNLLTSVAVQAGLLNADTCLFDIFHCTMKLDRRMQVSNPLLPAAWGGVEC